jgi:hypothetical protein
MDGWPKLSPRERILIAQIAGTAERCVSPMRDGLEVEEIAHALHQVSRDRRRLILSLAAQAYVDDELEVRRQAAALLVACGADREEARRFRQARLKQQGFDLAAVADGLGQQSSSDANLGDQRQVDAAE